MSLIHREGTVTDGKQTDEAKRDGSILHMAVERAVKDSKKSNRSVAKELSTHLIAMAAELERITLSEHSSVEDKLRAAELLVRIQSKAVLAESSVRKKSAIRSHIRLQKDLLAQRQLERAEKRAKKNKQIAEQLAETEKQLGGTNGIIENRT